MGHSAPPKEVGPLVRSQLVISSRHVLASSQHLVPASRYENRGYAQGCDTDTNDPQAIYDTRTRWAWRSRGQELTWGNTALWVTRQLA